MTKWQRKLMRWGLLLLLCYGATLIQLTLIRHADTVHHKEQSSRLPPGTRSTSSGRRITSVRRGQPWRQPRRQQQQQQRVESPPKPQELPLRIPPSSRKSQQPARNRTKGHLYLCINTKGRRVTLPRMPTFIIGGKQASKYEETHCNYLYLAINHLCIRQWNVVYMSHTPTLKLSSTLTIFQAPKREEPRHS